MKKKTLLIGLLAALSAFCAGEASAQKVRKTETPSHFSVYGFVRNYLVFDTHEVSAGTQDLFFYMPTDSDMLDGVDRNAKLSFRMLALTSRLGLRFTGYRFGDLQVSGAVEGDFYCMSGSTATFRLRQAYAGLLWDNLELGDLLLNVGQTWHPLAADLPHVTNLETGAPFNPLNRSPQIMAHWTVGKFTWTGGILYPMQYLPVGPSESTSPYWRWYSQKYEPVTTYGVTKSADFNKYGLIPEVYLGVSFRHKGFLGRVGVNMFSILPGWEAPEVEIVDEATRELAFDFTVATPLKTTRLFAFSPFVFLEYTHGSFQIRAKGVLAQSGEHLNLLSGYGATYNWKTHAMEYTPMQDVASFLSFQYGKKFQVMCMLGYMQQIGTTKALFVPQSNRTLWLNDSADPAIQRACRATPTLAYNLGKLTFALEYNCTAAWFGEGNRNRGGLFETGHWVLNHRVEQMIKFNF